LSWNWLIATRHGEKGRNRIRIKPYGNGKPWRILRFWFLVSGFSFSAATPIEFRTPSIRGLTGPRGSN
jgi:hypothetical protein